MKKYLYWRRGMNGRWIGTGDHRWPNTHGKHWVIRRGERAGKTIVYLDRPTYGTEVCKNIRHAKEYANELARLAGFPACS
jgi:hypothetical protein